MEITFKTVQKVVNRFKGKTARIDNLLTDTEIFRMTATASKIPIAKGSKDLLIDIGGSVLWLPIYIEILGYKEVVFLCRSRAGQTHVFGEDEMGISKGVNVEILDCDAELSEYPIDFLEKMKNNKKSIIGYIGIANMGRIDSDLLDFLLEKRPDWQFVFIGPADSDLAERYLKYKNVHYILPVDYQSLPDYISYFDVAIVPFKINEHTKGNDLLKFHDFLAMGKPIVSTEIGGANDIRDVIRIAQGPSDFLEKIEKSLFDDSHDDVLKRKNVALKNSWHNRIKELEQLIKNRVEK